MSVSPGVGKALHRHGGVVLALTLAIAACGCDRGDRGKDAKSDSTASREGARPIGSRDSLMNTIAPHLAVWTSMWQAALPRFRTDSLYAAGVSPAFRSVYRMSAKDLITADVTFHVFGETSPDRRYHLVFDYHREISEDGDIGEDADSAPALLDQQEETAMIFEFCGTPCGFDYGTWVSPTRFALGGWADVDATSAWKVGRLGIYSVEDSSVTLYLTRPMPASDYERYRSAWTVWVDARYRAYENRRRGGTPVP